MSNKHYTELIIHSDYHNQDYINDFYEQLRQQLSEVETKDIIGHEVSIVRYEMGAIENYMIERYTGPRRANAPTDHIEVKRNEQTLKIVMCLKSVRNL